MKSKQNYNVILIGIDTLRADHLGCYGYSRSTSPNIDAFAEEAVLFKNCFSQAPITAPSFMSIFTSRFPAYHGIIDNISPLAGGRAYIADKRVPALAEVLRDNGYKTAAFTGGGNLYPKLGFDRGFDYYSHQARDFIDSDKCIPRDEIYYWLKEFRQKKFFLFFHTYAVHNPWYTPKYYWNRFDSNYSGKIRLNKIFTRPEKVRKLKTGPRKSIYLAYMDLTDPGDSADMEYLKSIYDGAIQYADDFFGNLIFKLHDLNLDQRTIIIFTSDHGEEFGDHGQVGHRQLYNELLHVPLIAKIPGKPAAEINTIARSIDIFPTLLSALGIKINFSIQGVDLFSSASGSLPAVADTEIYGQTIQNNLHKYIYPQYRPRRGRIDELYDLNRDPREKKNIALNNPKLMNKMIEKLEYELHHRISLPLAQKRVMYLNQ